jgi:hypothetical protein
MRHANLATGHAAADPTLAGPEPRAGACTGLRARTPLPIGAALLAAAVLASGTGRAAAEEASGFSFSGMQRTRFETVDPQFRPRLSDRDRALAVRTSLVFRAKLPAIDVVGEIMDSRVGLNDSGSFLSATQINTLEPIQSYVALHLPARGEHAAGTLRLGRMTLDLGKRRLLARSRYRNAVTNFTGADWEWRGAHARSVRVFYLQPMEALPRDAGSLLDNERQLDHGRRHSAFWGLYYAPPRARSGRALETYLLAYRVSPVDQPASAVDLRSFGLRVYRPATPRDLSYEAEAVLQRGTSGGTVAGSLRSDLPVSAYFVHVEAGYAFPGHWAANLVVQYDLASGDGDPLDARNERFDTLFGARRFDFGPTGIFGPFFRSNLRTPGVRLTFRPETHWQGMVAYRGYRLASARDAWVGSGLADPSGQSGNSLGRELEASFTWAAVERRLGLEIGAAKLALGAFPGLAAGAPPRGDPTYYYAALTTRF